MSDVIDALMGDCSILFKLITPYSLTSGKNSQAVNPGAPVGSLAVLRAGSAGSGISVLL